MDHIELSQIAFGLVWEGRLSPNDVPSKILAEPYDVAIEILKKKNGSREDVAKRVSPDALNKAVHSVKNMNGLGEDVDWVKACMEANSNVRMGIALRKAAQKKERNEDFDLLPLLGDLQASLAGQVTGLALAKEVDYSRYKPFQKCGYDIWDKVVGNFPQDGPIVVFGKTGVGKSHFGSMLINEFLHTYKKKTAGIYTLEMSAEHWMYRETHMYPTMNDIVNDRLYVSGSVRNIEELVAEVSMHRLDIVLIDDMDNIVSHSAAEEYENVYRRVKEICRFMKIPVIVLGQPNREAKKADRFLTSYDIAWSGAGENSAAALIALQEMSLLDVEEGYDAYPLDDEKKRFVIFLKSRDDWPIQRGPGAIRIEADENTPLWMGQAYNNTLYKPYASGHTIAQQKGTQQLKKSTRSAVR
jgi:AAA domain